MNGRAKGVTFERQVAQAFTDAGFEVRGLESGGDHFVIARDGQVTHVECKRHKRLRLPEWLTQQERDCPAGVRRLLVFRQDRRPPYAVMPLEQAISDAVARLP